ncbi:cupin domain-containing protein [Roseovarius aestuariivivens]|uniref:cupin domain-containing protein n=1 Tax=Roseovarius aestuariivivens TaxID=1888910 RepID=UPI001436BA5E|nr:cupin domain-containing protein [Roseovarius aestuariivivens]
MIRYDTVPDPASLTQWPFDAPESAYEILCGAPRASGRLDAGGPGHATRTGIWHCTAGTFACTEQGDELMTVLAGKGTLTDHATGTTQPLAPGTTLFLRDQSRVTWQITEDLTKVFFGHKASGY